MSLSHANRHDPWGPTLANSAAQSEHRAADYVRATRVRAFAEPLFRAPRLWSNQELARVAPLFDGDVVNVSAWRDEDKAGRHYRDYFIRARSYTLTNFESGMRGWQGLDGEIFLDLEAPLPSTLNGRFDAVFNHTALEHIYEFRRAFANLCALSRDVVIIVVPWLQPLHGDYGDYWRFSPMAIARLFTENDLTPARIVWNTTPRTSVYIFAVGVRDRVRWADAFEFDCDPNAATFTHLPAAFAGARALPAGVLADLRSAIAKSGVGRLARRLRGTGV